MRLGRVTLVQFDSHVVGGVATEETPQNEDEPDDCYAYHNIKPVVSDERCGCEFEENDYGEEHHNSLKWTTPQDPWRTARHLRKLFV